MPPNGTVTWNGTDTINGVQCDRFDFYDNGGTVSFYGTKLLTPTLPPP